MIVKLLTEHHLEFLSSKGGWRGSSESTHVKMTHCWKSHALAQLILPMDSSTNVEEKKERSFGMKNEKKVLNKTKIEVFSTGEVCCHVTLLSSICVSGFFDPC